jgi:hypothetical protein
LLTLILILDIQSSPRLKVMHLGRMSEHAGELGCGAYELGALGG